MPEQAPYSSIPVAPNLLHYFVPIPLAQRLQLHASYCLTINGTPPAGLTNPAGYLLDGAGNGKPGSNYVTTLTSSNLAGSASQRPTAAVVKARAKGVIGRVKTILHKHTK